MELVSNRPLDDLTDALLYTHPSSNTHVYTKKKKSKRKTKKKNFKMVVKLVSNRPLEDLPFPQCTSQHSPIFKYSYKEKEIIELKKDKKKQIVQDLVSKRPLDLPSRRCTSEHSPIFKQLCAPRSRSVNQCQYQKELDLCTQQQQNI